MLRAQWLLADLTESHWSTLNLCATQSLDLEHKILPTDKEDVIVRFTQPTNGHEPGISLINIKTGSVEELGGCIYPPLPKNWQGYSVCRLTNATYMICGWVKSGRSAQISTEASCRIVDLSEKCSITIRTLQPNGELIDLPALIHPQIFIQWESSRKWHDASIYLIPCQRARNGPSCIVKLTPTPNGVDYVVTTMLCQELPDTRFCEGYGGQFGNDIFFLAFQPSDKDCQMVCYNTEEREWTVIEMKGRVPRGTCKSQIVAFKADLWIVCQDRANQPPMFYRMDRATGACKLVGNLNKCSASTRSFSILGYKDSILILGFQSEGNTVSTTGVAGGDIIWRMKVPEKNLRTLAARWLEVAYDPSELICSIEGIQPVAKPQMCESLRSILNSKSYAECTAYLSK